MKNKSYIWISFIILVFGILVVPKIIDRVSKNDIVKTDRLSANTGLYKVGPVPKFTLTNQNNATISNQTYLNKVYLVEFFFTTCPSICPIMNKNMAVIEKFFEKRNDFGIASITINPENDTPAVLKEHANLLEIKSPNWHMLTGKKDYIMNLSNTGFNLYAAQNPKINGGFEHSGLFALVDKKGNIRCRKDNFNNPIVYYDGLKSEGVEMLKKDISILLSE